MFVFDSNRAKHNGQSICSYLNGSRSINKSIFHKAFVKEDQSIDPRYNKGTANRVLFN